MQPPEKVHLIKGEQPLEDARKLSDLKVENDDVVAMCYLQPGVDMAAGGGILRVWHRLCICFV
jgi:hypothetical protein